MKKLDKVSVQQAHLIYKCHALLPDADKEKFLDYVERLGSQAEYVVWENIKFHLSDGWTCDEVLLLLWREGARPLPEAFDIDEGDNGKI